jgi:hypothetical protein
MINENKECVLVKFIEKILQRQRMIEFQLDETYEVIIEKYLIFLSFIWMNEY